METIYNNGKSLETVHMLNITVSPPQLCHFCGEPIIKLNGKDSDSLVMHHITYIPEVKVPTHFGCHTKYHNTHPKHPKNPESEYRKRFIENLGGNILCYFCGEEITKKFGWNSESLTIHSLDGNHNNWDPDNKVATHHGCHQSFHVSGDKNPMKLPEVRAKIVGDKNPMKDPKIAKKVDETRRANDPEGKRFGKTWKTRRERGSKPNDNKKAWDTRRKLYPPNGMKPKEIKKDD